MMEQTAPAFQLYASDTIADKHYRLMSLEERGLLLSLLCECWVNRSVPADPDELGKWLGFQGGVIKAALSSRVVSFFSPCNGELINPKLERYRKELEERREKMSKGGIRGAKAKWRKVSEGDSHPTNLPNGVAMGSRVEARGKEKSRSESSERVTIADPFVAEYEAAESCTAEAYVKARG
jgi:uncharacterized protein YdaU (DUF1376 family)